MCPCFEFGSLQLLADKTNDMQTLKEVISNINRSTENIVNTTRCSRSLRDGINKVSLFFTALRVVV